MFVFFCIAEDAFKEHYFGELQSLPKALSFGACSSLKIYLYFPNGQEEALAGIEVMLMQRGAIRRNSVYSTKAQPVLNIFNGHGFILTLISRHFNDKKTNIVFIFAVWKSGS